MICSLLLYNYYLAAIVAIRMSSPIRKMNDSLNELKKSQMSYASQKLTYLNFYIKVSLLTNDLESMNKKFYEFAIFDPKVSIF